jgi:hypothetical protein
MHDILQYSKENKVIVIIKQILEIQLND